MVWYRGLVPVLVIQIVLFSSNSKAQSAAGSITSPTPYQMQIEQDCELQQETNSDMQRYSAGGNADMDALKSFNYSKCTRFNDYYSDKNSINRIYLDYVKATEEDLEIAEKNFARLTLLASAGGSPKAPPSINKYYTDGTCLVTRDSQGTEINRESVKDCHQRWKNHYVETLINVRDDTAKNNAAINAVVVGKDKKRLDVSHTENQGNAQTSRKAPSVVHDIYQLSKIQKGATAIPQYILNGTQSVRFTPAVKSNFQQFLDKKMQQKGGTGFRTITRVTPDVDAKTIQDLKLSDLEVESDQSNAALNQQIVNKVQPSSTDFARQLRKDKKKMEDFSQQEEGLLRAKALNTSALPNGFTTVSQPSNPQSSQRERFSKMLESYNEQAKKVLKQKDGLEKPGKDKLSIAVELTPNPKTRAPSTLQPTGATPNSKRESVEEELEDELNSY